MHGNNHDMTCMHACMRACMQSCVCCQLAFKCAQGECVVTIILYCLLRCDVGFFFFFFFLNVGCGRPGKLMPFLNWKVEKNLLNKLYNTHTFMNIIVSYGFDRTVATMWRLREARHFLEYYTTRHRGIGGVILLYITVCLCTVQLLLWVLHFFSFEQRKKRGRWKGGLGYRVNENGGPGGVIWVMGHIHVQYNILFITIHDIRENVAHITRYSVIFPLPRHRRIENSEFFLVLYAPAMCDIDELGCHQVLEYSPLCMRLQK